MRDIPPHHSSATKDHLISAQLTEWLAAQSQLAVLLAEAAFAVGQMDSRLAAMPNADRAGVSRRLALREVESMLWAQGTPLKGEEIGRDLQDARAGADLDVMAQARWAMRRLEGQGGLTDLRGFLGLRRSGPAGSGPSSGATQDSGVAVRPTVGDFDDVAAEYLALDAQLWALHSIARAPMQMILWRRAGLSPDGTVIEAAVWTARAMGVTHEALRFAPLGSHGRRVWQAGGVAARRLEGHLLAVRDGALEAKRQIVQLERWVSDAQRWAAGIKGSNPRRIIGALVAHPLLSAPVAETATGVSRMTAERVLNKMEAAGLIREVTGGTRFRLWTAGG